MTTYTTNVGLGCPATDDGSWDIPIRATIALLDALTPIGSGGVRFRENPSTSLYVSVAPALFRQANGQVGTYAGVTTALTASTTTYLWLTDAGTLGTGSGWPATAYTPLAIVVAGSSTITTITDARIVLGSVGAKGREPVSAKTTTYTLTAADGLIEANATGGAFTVTLPTAVGITGASFRVIKTDSSGNAVTVATTSSQTINGASTVSLASQWSGKTFISDGSNWVSF